MNREEINEALKLIKEPITVNCIEYKYFDQENYEKLLRVYENCRWFVDNYEQVLQNIKNLQQELQIKDNKINDLKNSIGDYQEAVGDYQNELKRKDNIINELKEWLKYKKEQMEQFDLDKRKETGAFWYSTMGNIETFLDKLNELEGDNK